MKVNNLKACLALTILGLFVLSSAATAEVTWDAVKKKAKGAKSYHVTYEYSGPRGSFTFDYGFTRDAIRTQIMKSSPDKTKRGTVVVWDKSFKNGDYIRAKTGGGNVLRKTTHKEVENTPFYQSIFEMIFKQTDECGAPSSSASGDKTVFTFKCAGGSYKVTTDSEGNILKTERRDGTEGDETREFSGHTWNGSVKTGF